jgi:glycosyltransferase involved in cell wall biosynthesis
MTSGDTSSPSVVPTWSVAVIIPARNESLRIGLTVRSASEISGVDLVVVVDDGSTDTTGDIAQRSGAVVTRHEQSKGKAAAMVTGAELVRVLDGRDRLARPRLLLFLDADLEDSARHGAPLVTPVATGTADMTIAVLPRQHTGGGGHGLVVRLAASGIERATGFSARQPLSGQRCLTRQAFEAARPLASGFGVETGLTIDLLRRGFRVTEIECDLHHRVTGRDFAARLHRATQYAHVAKALAVRGLPAEARNRLRARRHSG